MKLYPTDKVQRLTITALLTALTAVSTMIIKLPVPATGGYIHPGDGLVLLSGFLLGPVYGTFAAGAGSALADLLSGYLVYAPATLVIKGVTALTASLLYTKLLHTLRARDRLHLALAGIAGEICMVLGYFLFESALYGPPAAAAGLPFNLLQGVFGVIIALVLFPLL
ncbi:MAG: ECF transporter S component [Lachnospiraceae bacterium]|nr:ECF transporter S component [Lachnospiraceae bacterium]